MRYRRNTKGGILYGLLVRRNPFGSLNLSTEGITLSGT